MILIYLLKIVDSEKPELVKTKASTRVNSLGTQELLNSLVFDDNREPRNEKAERYMEFRRVKTKDQGSVKTKTDEFHVDLQKDLKKVILSLKCFNGKVLIFIGVKEFDKCIFKVVLFVLLKLTFLKETSLLVTKVFLRNL